MAKPKPKPKPRNREVTRRRMTAEDWRDRRRQQMLAAFKLARKRFAKSATESLKHVKKKIFTPTIDARNVSERSALRHKRFNEIVKKRIEKIRLRFERQLVKMFPEKDLTLEQYNALILKIDALVKKHEKESTYYAQAITYSIRALAGFDGKISPKDYAVFYSLLDNIDTLYAKNVKIADVLIAIQKDMNPIS